MLLSKAGHMDQIATTDANHSARIHRLYPRLFLAIFLPLFALLNVTNRDMLFRTPAYEQGDDAANALQIHRAKSGRELYGNYSRFLFNHPGPGFFYAYALAEAVLYDQLKVVPMPRNAHLWMTLLMQCGFFAAAIALAAASSRNPAVVIGLAVVIGAWHFGRIDGAFFDNWPPHVLLMPFLCLVVSAAVVSQGRGEGLFTLVLSGSLLVHGHVAQPLFVLPITATAIFFLLRRRRKECLPLIARGDWLSLSVCAVFILPLLIDAFHGRDSNLYRILLHVAHHPGASQTFGQSILCFASYFVYCDDQTIFNAITPASIAIFTQHLGILLTWGLLTLSALGLAWRYRRRGPEPRTAWRLALFYLLGVALTLVWGMRQDGGFTPFNSFLNSGLIFVPVILLAMLVADRLAAFRGPMLTIAAIIAPLIATGILVRAPKTDDLRGAEIAGNLPSLLHADPLPDAAKLLEFGFLEGDWYETVTLARALQRSGLQFFVAPWWAFMFGKEQVFVNQGHVLENNRISRWRIVRRDAVPDALPLTQEYGVVFSQAPALGPLPATISFADTGNHGAFILFGIGDTEESAWAWTNANVAALEFQSGRQEADILAELDAGAFGSRTKPQRAAFIVNGERLIQWQIGQRGTYAVKIPANVWNRRNPVRIVLELPDARSPARIWGTGERRILGLSLHALSFTPAVEPAPTPSISR